MTQDLFNQSFFNTTSENGAELKKQIKKASVQNEVIYKIFQNYAETNFTCSDIEKMTRYLITSVRRAVTCLHDKGALVRTGKRWNQNTQANEFTYKLK